MTRVFISTSLGPAMTEAVRGCATADFEVLPQPDVFSRTAAGEAWMAVVGCVRSETGARLVDLLRRSPALHLLIEAAEIDDLPQGLDPNRVELVMRSATVQEATTRLRTFIRRHSTWPTRVLLGDRGIDLGTGLISDESGGELSRLELRLLRYLWTHRDRPVSRAELLTHVWGYHPKSRSRAIDTTIRRLRTKIDTNPPTWLRTERGKGWRLSGARLPRPRGTADQLDAQADVLIGREAERSAALTLLTEQRLCCVCGPPGAGRTAFARHVARHWRDRFVGFPALTMHSIDGPLDTPELERIGTGAGQRAHLVVLDDVTPSPTLEAAVWSVVRRCESLRILIVLDTDRTPLPAVRLGALSPADGARVLSYARRTVDPHAPPAPADAEAVSALLDGMPAALTELGRRGRLRSLSQLREWLVAWARPAGHLTVGGSPPVAGIGHPTIRRRCAAIGPDARQELTGLVVFAGGVSTAAAEATALTAGCGRRLETYVAAGLLRAEGDARWRVPEPVRQALTAMARPQWLRAARLRHVRYFEGALEAPDTLSPADHPNLDAALVWCALECPHRLPALRAAIGRVDGVAAARGLALGAR